MNADLTPTVAADAGATGAEGDVVESNWAALRAQSGLSLEEISTRTNIPVRKLEAIEAWDFAALGTPTFAQGYIRSYAKMIGQDAETLLDQYRAKRLIDEGSAAAGQGEREEEGMRGAPLAPGQRLRKLGVLHISLAVIAAWVAFMLLSRGGDETPATVAPAAVASPEVMARPSPAPAVTEHDRQVTPVEEVESQSSAEAVAEGSLSASTVVESAHLEQAPERLPMETSGALETSEEDVLVFSFAEECWVSVSDASGQVLVAELKAKGDNLRLFGRAPFELMLGNARGVTLTINGQPVSTQPSAGNTTLRTTVARPE